LGDPLLMQLRDSLAAVAHLRVDVADTKVDVRALRDKMDA
jgi:hypothetical protein